jgi:hypothetical protein
VVFNTLNWTRSGLHVLYVDNQILPREMAFRITDDRNRDIPVQLVQSRAEGNYWALWLEDVPPLGYRTYRVLAGNTPRKPDPVCSPSDTLQNGYYRLILDPQSGAIRSMFDKALGQELLDPARSWQMGQFIYERLSDRHHMEGYRLGDHTRTTLRGVRTKPGVDGPIWQSVVVSGTADGFAGEDGITCEIRLFKTARRVDLLFKGRKTAVGDPEAVYIAFPFSLPEGKLVFEAQGGIVHPGENQLRGTANDWNTAQNFAAVRAPGSQIVLVSDEIPLMQFGAINTGRYQPEAKPASNQIFSWVLNNYWTTNFRSAQEGEMTWRYVLTSERDAGNTFATRFGWGTRVPFVSRVLPGGTGATQGTASRSAWPFAPSPLLLVSSRPDGQGIILHLREVAGRQTILTLSGTDKGRNMEEVDALGRRLRAVTSLPFAPLESRFVRIRR